MGCVEEMSLEQSLAAERAAYAELALVSTQISALTCRFHRDWLALDARRNAVLAALHAHSRVVSARRERLELALFPPEQREWAACALSIRPLDADVCAPISASSPVRLVRGEDAQMGRVWRVAGAVPRGALLLDEAPLLFSAFGETDALLPAPLRRARADALARLPPSPTPNDDAALVALFFHWLAAMRFGAPGGFARRFADLCCPLAEAAPRRLAHLSALAERLRAAAPPPLGPNAADALRCLVTLCANAVRFGAAGWAVFADISLAAHSCDPNAAVVWRHGGRRAELRALREMAPGECVSIAYVPVCLPRAERRLRLRHLFFFDCACACCADGADTARLLRDASSAALLCPVGDGGRWRRVPLQQVEETEETEKAEKAEEVGGDDAAVLAALRGESAFVGGDDPPAETAALDAALVGGAVCPLHGAFLRRALRAAAEAREKRSEWAAVRGALVDVLRRALRQVTADVFGRPRGFDSLLESNGDAVGEEAARWHESLRPKRLLERHAPLIVSLWEMYATLREEDGDVREAGDAWVNALVLIRYGLCQWGSDRALQAQLRALHCRRIEKETAETVTDP